MRALIPFVLLAACDGDLGLRTGSKACPGVPGVELDETDTEAPSWQPLDTVVLITVDTLNARILQGNEQGWEVAPTLSAFFDEAVLLPHTLSPRGLTQPSLSTLVTATYPRNHGIRENDRSSQASGSWLTEQFQQAGWRTLGYSANRCNLLDRGIDERVCTWGEEEPELGNLEERDRALVEALGERLDALEPGEPTFLWLHLNQPHKPYGLVEEYYELFHPEPYDGEVDPSDPEQGNDIARGLQSFGEADRAQLEAWYASQVRRTDDHIAQVFAKLQEIDRYDEALVVFGSDHGEELGLHNDYWFHGCSPYTSVLGVLYAIRAPVRGLQPARLDGWVGLVDIAPTIAQLSGAFAWEGLCCGRSLVSDLLAGEVTPAPLFFERGVQTAGVVLADHKLHLTTEPDFDGCTPFTTEGGAYPGEPLELYDLASDPHEADNLAVLESQQAETLQTLVCDWVLAEDWVAWGERDNALVEACGG